MIRLAIKDDVTRIIELLSQVLEVHASIRPDVFISGTTKYDKEALINMIEDDNCYIYVSTIDDYVVGYAMCELRMPKFSSTMRPHKIMFIDDFCVDEKYRRNHIGESLFKYVLNEAKKIGCYEVMLSYWEGNETAKKFYEKMGMKTRSEILEYIL